MRSTFGRLLVLLAVLVLAGAAWMVLQARGRADGQAAAGPNAAPEFTLERYDGGAPVSLSRLRGKVVLLYFWFPT